MSRLADPAHVTEQYRTPENFDVRVRLYQLYATAEQTWPRWLFERFHLAGRERVLEVGTGTGNVWRENVERIPADVRITLSDRSPGMLDAARERLGEHAKRFEFEEIDVQAIPLDDGCLDVVIANHMLYHVPDRARAIGEICRVLRPGGRFYAGTNHWTHLLEVRDLVARHELDTDLVAPRRDRSFFDLDTAAAAIAERFPTLRVARRQDALEITDASALVEYIRSTTPSSPANDERLAGLTREVERQIELTGSFWVSVCAGVVEARKATRPG